VVAAIRASSHPTVRQASRARSGSRSTITGTSRPGVCGTWERNIEPNFPAPISATRTGFPAARRVEKMMQIHGEFDPAVGCDLTVAHCYRREAMSPREACIAAARRTSRPLLLKTSMPGTSPGMTKRLRYSAA
jgi:hypothetical protein